MDINVLKHIFSCYRPSASENLELSPEFNEAETIGRKYKECARYHKDCSISLLDFISFLGNSFY